jgi:hypothetical protein
MAHTLSRRLATIAAGVQHAVDTGARLSPHDAAALHADLLTCAALARDMEAPRARPARLHSAVEADRRMFGKAHQDSAP